MRIIKHIEGNKEHGINSIRRVVSEFIISDTNKRVGKPESTFDIVEQVWMHKVQMNKVGDTKPGHAHKFPHVTLVAKGSVQIVEVDLDGTETVVGEAGIDEKILVPEGIGHKLIALEDNTITYCIEQLPTREKLDESPEDGN